MRLSEIWFRNNNDVYLGNIAHCIEICDMSLGLFQFTQKWAFFYFFNYIFYFFIYKLLPRFLGLIWFTYMYAVHMNLKHTVCPSMIVTWCKSPLWAVLKDLSFCCFYVETMHCSMDTVSPYTVCNLSFH